ncbi:MAG: hypothetical protein MUC43_14395 [Pirellula sp.]|jgi:hypothetical protein|nr:hypothetical protein [Pirellula sp.]
MNRAFARLSVTFIIFLLCAGNSSHWALGQVALVRLASFDVDATPPLGIHMAYDPVRRLDELSLRCRGVVLLSEDKPIVLCAVDWIGIANEGYDTFRRELATAAETEPNRVAVHAIHQHDAPGCDFTAERLVNEMKVDGYPRFDGEFHREVIQRASDAVRASIKQAVPVTHYGYGEAIVEQVASNRRVEIKDGKVGRMRGSSSKIQELIQLPEGVIDPVVSSLVFWNESKPVAVISSYACHPQSYYRTGVPSPDFPGIARFMRGQDLNDTLHVHFNGAGGNIAAGKYNDGSQPNRMILAQRLYQGLKQAFENARPIPLESEAIGWDSVPVRLPLAAHLNKHDLETKMRAAPARGYISLADQLAWCYRVEEGQAIDITCLKIGSVRMLHMPGELFVEYQLAAKKMRPDLRIMMAAYGDYGPGYIGTAVSYSEGGYETAPTSSNVSPESESILLDAMQSLLKPKD